MQSVKTKNSALEVNITFTCSYLHNQKSYANVSCRFWKSMSNIPRFDPQRYSLLYFWWCNQQRQKTPPYFIPQTRHWITQQREEIQTWDRHSLKALVEFYKTVIGRCDCISPWWFAGRVQRWYVSLPWFYMFTTWYLQNQRCYRNVNYRVRKSTFESMKMYLNFTISLLLTDATEPKPKNSPASLSEITLFTIQYIHHQECYGNMSYRV